MRESPYWWGCALSGAGALLAPGSSAEATISSVTLEGAVMESGDTASFAQVQLDVALEAADAPDLLRFSGVLLWPLSGWSRGRRPRARMLSRRLSPRTT